MKRIRAWGVGIALMGGALGFASCGRAEEAGEKIDRAVEKAGDKIEDAGDKIEEKTRRPGPPPEPE